MYICFLKKYHAELLRLKESLIKIMFKLLEMDVSKIDIYFEPNFYFYHRNTFRKHEQRYLQKREVIPQLCRALLLRAKPLLSYSVHCQIRCTSFELILSIQLFLHWNEPI